MTESEFQEFLITVGYRYNKKSQSAFNSFEGFHTIIEFRTSENRYAIRLSAMTEDQDSLDAKIKEFASENKDFVSRAFYKKHMINISIKMSVDSEIDRERLKKAASFMMGLCKSDLITPVCIVCSRNRKTGLYVVGQELMPICERCIVRKRRQYEHRRDMFDKKTQNMPAGILGAVFGAALGASVYVLIYQIFSFWGIPAGLIAACCFGGFVVTGERATKLSAVVCGAISFLFFLAAEYMALVAGMSILIEHEGGGIAVTEAMEMTNISLTDISYLKAILLEIAVGSAVMIAVGVVYFLKRMLTRPLKISKNIL